jgi:hypothetical protein
MMRFRSHTATAATVAAIALTGAMASTAHAQASQVLSFFNTQVQGMLDLDCSTPNGPITWPATSNDACQHWQLDQVVGGYLLESGINPGRCIQAPQQVGDYATIANCNAVNPTQTWLLEPSGDQVFIEQASDPDHVLAATQLYGRIAYEEKTGGPEQLWETTPPV